MKEFCLVYFISFLYPENTSIYAYGLGPETSKVQKIRSNKTRCLEKINNKQIASDQKCRSVQSASSPSGPSVLSSHDV